MKCYVSVQVTYLLDSIFSPYGFEIQHLTTNYLDLQNSINHNSGDVPSNCVK